MLRRPTIFRFQLILCCGVIGLLTLDAARGAEQNGNKKKGVSMSYGEARSFLGKYTKLVELRNDSGARVAVTPEWQGRVMTSTCDGAKGPSFGFINRDYIESGKFDIQFNNYGAEERLWLSPEGGQFSLWFKPGVKQELKNWYTAPGLNEGAWKVEHATDRKVSMTASMQIQNASATTFSLDVARDVRLLETEDLRKFFGDWAAGLTNRADVKLVGYETANRVINRGEEFSKKTGLVSIWILGMMNAGPKTVILVPYKSGSMGELGPIIKSDYFGPINLFGPKP